MALAPFSSSVNVGSADFKTVTHKNLSGDHAESVRRASAQTPSSDNVIQPLSSSTGALHAAVNGLTSNGTANEQFEALCTEIKAAGVKIFTVGYHTVGSANNARRVNCASPDADDVIYSYTTDTVDGLIEAFHVVAALAVDAASDVELRPVE